MILPKFIDLSAETALYSRFGGHKGRRSYGGGGGEEEAYVFNLIPPANQGVSPGQPKRSLRMATAVRYRYYVQLVAIKRGWLRVANLKSRSARLRGGVKLVAVPNSSDIKRLIAISPRRPNLTCLVVLYQSLLRV
jgi:hypothetical protein